MTIKRNMGLGLTALMGLGILAAWVFLPMVEYVHAGCNSLAKKRFEVTNLRLGAYTNNVFVQFVPTNVTVTFKAEFDTTLPSGDSASFTCNWSGVVNKGLLHSVVPGYNKEETSTNFATAGVKTETFSYDGKDWINEPNTCEGSKTTNLTVVTVEYVIDHVCTTGTHSAYHDIAITVTPDPPGTTIALELRKDSGTRGAAKFASTGASTASISGSTTLTIEGTQESDVISNMVMEAKIGSTLYASKKFTVVDVGTQEVTEVLHTINTTNDTTQTDDTKTVWVCQTSNDTATVKLSLSWMPTGYPRSEFWWQAMLSSGAPATEWGGPGTFENNPTNLVWNPGPTTNREFQIRTWFDCDNDDNYLNTEPHRIIDVKVVDFTKLELKNPATGATVSDMTRPDEPQSTNNTVYLGETTNGTAEMRIQGWWLPVGVNSNWFRWRITLTNAAESDTTQWMADSKATFATNPVSVTWTNRLDANGETNRAFKVRGWYDCNRNNQYDADEPHRLLYVTVLKVELDIWNGGADLDNGQATGSEGTPVADTDEETVGAYLLVNWDDDDADGVMNNDGTWPTPPEPDLNENSVVNEDNLAKLKPTVEPLLDAGTIELEVSGSDAGKIKLWTQSTKGTQISLTSNKKIWNLANSTEKVDFQTFMNNGYWIEGTDVGTAERGVTFTLRYKETGGSEICKDDCKATVVMIHLGNAVYRELMATPLKERCHAAIVYSFDGPVTGNNLKDANKYGVVQMPGMDPVAEKLKGMTDATGFEYWYCYTHTGDIQDNLDGFRKRLRILKVAYWAYHDWSKNYCAFDCMNPSGWDWDGTLSDVAELRCDGLVELAYEFNGIMVWGKIVDGSSPHYDMRNNDYLDEHNDWQWGDDPEDWDWDMYATCLPITQGGFADQYIAEHEPSYSGPAYRGNLWQTTFQEQRLTIPDALTPEKHEH